MSRKVIISILTIIFSFSCVSGGGIFFGGCTGSPASATPDDGKMNADGIWYGSGTEDNPYLIMNSADLLNMAYDESIVYQSNDKVNTYNASWNEAGLMGAIRLTSKGNTVDYGNHISYFSIKLNDGTETVFIDADNGILDTNYVTGVTDSVQTLNGVNYYDCDETVVIDW